jgi:hypothetical protein
MPASPACSPRANPGAVYRPPPAAWASIGACPKNFDRLKCDPPEQRFKSGSLRPFLLSRFSTRRSGWRSQQNYHKSASQRLELAHLPKAPEKQGVPGASGSPCPLAEADSPQLVLTSFPRSASEIVERDSPGKAGTSRIICKGSSGRSGASALRDVWLTRRQEPLRSRRHPRRGRLTAATPFTPPPPASAPSARAG